MKANFVFYKGKIRSLPKGLFILILLLLLVIIPILITAFVFYATATFIGRKILGLVMPGKPKQVQPEYTEYEIVEEKNERKSLPH